jgi:tudor domain-containing protein 1/4/6/7
MVEMNFLNSHLASIKLVFYFKIAMLSLKERPQEIKIGHIYLTSIAECWHRIKIVETNEKEANCICIDNGDYEWIGFNDIYVCKPEFLLIAPQAFKLTLFGLEEFENNPNVTHQLLFEQLVYKSLVAEVMMTQEYWETNKSKPIKTILYDTSTDEDVNLNASLINSILSSVSTASLSQKEINQITITYIGEDAVYCQLAKSASYIQSLINNISKEDLKINSGLYVDTSDKKKVYLIYDDKKRNWFRARLEKLIDSDKYLMLMIDQGYKTSVKVQDIYRLDKISYVLSLYPPQVLKFGLYNVNYSEDVKKKLLGMLPHGRQVFVSSLLNLTI